MKSTLRKIERALVFERAEVVVQTTVDELLGLWEQANRRGVQPPDALDFILRIMSSGFYLPSHARAISYLDRCSSQGELPDRRRLMRILLPWRC